MHTEKSIFLLYARVVCHGKTQNRSRSAIVLWIRNIEGWHCLAACWEVLSQKLWCCTECKKGTAEQRHFLSRLHLFLLVSPPLPLFLSSEDGWHASSDASSGSLTYFRKYHRFLLIALLSSRPLRTSPTGPTNPLITSSPRSPFIHAHVTASLHNTKIKTTRIFGNFLAVKGILWWSNLGSFWWNSSTMPVQFENLKK